MALKPADMDKCDAKARCLSGPNKGTAYSINDPCDGGSEFNPFTCDCNVIADTWGVCATYENSCTGVQTCRCQVFDVGAAGVPTQLTNTSYGGSATCASGTWAISFQAQFSNGSTVNVPIASGVNTEKQNLVSYDLVYDRPSGGYDCNQPDCSSTRSAVVRWKVSYATFATGCVPTTTLCFAFGDTPYSYNVSNLASNGEIQFATVPSGGIGTCSGTQNTSVAIVYPACVSGEPYFETITIGSPGCSVNTSAGAIATIYDQSITYSP